MAGHTHAGHVHDEEAKALACLANRRVIIAAVYFLSHHRNSLEMEIGLLRCVDA